jgi:outer membrane protein assembly factor BamB
MRKFIFTAAIAFGSATVAHAGSLDLQLGIINPSPDNNDLFGAAISLSAGKALIGAPSDATTGTGSGRAYVYDSSSGALLHTFENPTPATNDQFGGAVSLSGNLALVGAQNDALGASASGAAYLFDATTGTRLRSFANPTPAIVDNFGHSVSISGNRAYIRDRRRYGRLKCRRCVSVRHHHRQPTPDVPQSHAGER